MKSMSTHGAFALGLLLLLFTLVAAVPGEAQNSRPKVGIATFKTAVDPRLEAAADEAAASVLESFSGELRVNRIGLGNRLGLRIGRAELFGELIYTRTEFETVAGDRCRRPSWSSSPERTPTLSSHFCCAAGRNCLYCRQELMPMSQYTVRNVPSSIDRELRERAKRTTKTLNEVTIEALRRGLGFSNDEVVYDDLDDLAGTWQDDEAFDEAIADQDQIEPNLWR